jgi:hypothetical protein
MNRHFFSVRPYASNMLEVEAGYTELRSYLASRMDAQDKEDCAHTKREHLRKPGTSRPLNHAAGQQVCLIVGHDERPSLSARDASVKTRIGAAMSTNSCVSRLYI